VINGTFLACLVITDYVGPFLGGHPHPDPAHVQDLAAELGHLGFSFPFGPVKSSAPLALFVAVHLPDLASSAFDRPEDDLAAFGLDSSCYHFLLPMLPPERAGTSGNMHEQERRSSKTL
jgi:hypothetical protein